MLFRAVVYCCIRNYNDLMVNFPSELINCKIERYNAIFDFEEKGLKV